MGSRGPVPKRTEQRRRVNVPDGGFADRAPGAVAVSQPAANPKWHPLARDWYVSLGESGQAAFYEPSDWRSACVWAELLSRQLHSAKVNSQVITAWAAGATELLTTEGSRRRLRLELERERVVDAGEEHADATVTDLMSRLGG